ncbi:hypothetical protein [Halomonas sp. BM-2019]|uniref:hypothetical protein n=1 Tax=Halomonas sp. BM-2019 TaxID=2811227 RepID=UPI001B3C29C9|nr:MAG: hypothetical protein J5F18_13885 [Halomonas sp. BM-2019]
MPITESMTLLWLVYGFLSLVVVLTGYLGLAFLPRLLRLLITWLVAGVLWMPARFRLPLVEEGEFYTGFAPAAVVALVAFLERNAGVMLPALLLTLVGAAIGAAFGLWLWWRGRHRDDYVDMSDNEREAPPARRGGGERREPRIG